jgi:hypothetical protein
MLNFFDSCAQLQFLRLYDMYPSFTVSVDFSTFEAQSHNSVYQAQSMETGSINRAHI